MAPELATHAGAPPARDRVWLAILGLAIALGLIAGLAAGGSDLVPPLTPLVLVLLAAQLLALRSPREAFFVLVANAVFYPVLPVIAGRGANPIDILIIPTLVGAWLWFRPGHKREKLNEPAERARTGVVRAGLFYYGVALLSLVAMAVRGQVFQAADSFLLLLRSFEGAMYFVLASKLVRSPRDFTLVCGGILAGFLFSCLCNVSYFVPRAEFDVPRAGAVLILGAKNWYVANPNEAAASCLLLFAFALAYPLGRIARACCLIAITTLLVSTLSRSGLVAGFVFVGVLGLQKRWRWLWLLPVLVAAVFPFLPSEWVLRVARTLVLERGSFEAYSSLVRFFTWEASFRTFLAHPILGVGYLGYRFVSHLYNPFGAILVTAESIYLETAAGMGVLGLFALGWVGFAGLKLAGSVRRVTHPEGMAYRLASITPAYLAGIAAGNVTGDNLVGMMGVAQLALFYAMVAQAAAIERTSGVVAFPDRRAR